MAVIITGATGFLGSHLVKALLEQGYRVSILKRSYSETFRIKAELPYLNTFDVDKRPLVDIFNVEPVEAVVHTATCYGKNGASELNVFESNVVFPVRLLEAATAFGVKTFINTDTFINTGDVRYDYLQSYVLTKKHFLEWGKYCASKHRINFINAKLEHVYGPQDGESKFTTYVLKNCLKNVPELEFTAGKQRRDFVYVDDVVSAYLAILRGHIHHGESFQEYQIGTGRSTSIRDFAETAHRLAKSRTVLKFGELTYRNHEFMDSKADIGPLKTLGWSNKVVLEEGIKAIIREDGKKWANS